MAQLTTHVLDTMNGCPAAGMQVALYRLEGATPVLLREVTLDDDGRAGGPILDANAFRPGRYRLVFQVATYFRARGVALAEPPFLDEVPVEFGMDARQPHYHVPLLASPWSYTTYRGS